MKLDEFEAGGERFRLAPLSLKESRALYPHVARAFGPLIGVIAEVAKRAPQKAETPEDTEPETPKEDPLAGLDFLGLLSGRLSDVAIATVEVPALQDAFLAKSQWLNTNVKGKGKGTWVELSVFADDVFRRKHLRMLEWLIRCTILEFGDFLPGIGQGQQSETASG